MRNLLRCRRGSAALATVIALVPLIGVVALGGEAGSWYVTKQAAQNAADGAAYSGALTLACTVAGSSCTDPDTQTVAYRGKEFAAQNTFCNAGDTTAYPGSKCATSLPANVSQAVAIDIGDYSGGTFTTPPAGSGNAVRATVSQQQPAYLAAILGLTTVNIPTQAIALVNSSLLTPPCALALTGSLSFQGSPNINAPGCTLTSNDKANNALDFTGGGMSFTPGTLLSAAGGCTGSSTLCGASNVKTFQLPVIDPFSALDGALNTLCGANPTLPATCGLSTTGSCAISKQMPAPIAYTAATPCANNNVSTKGNTAVPPLAAGVYFISGTLTMTGGSSITGPGVTFILLPGATISMKGGATLTLSGPTSAPSASSLPASLQADASLFKGMAIYDASSAAVQFGGTSNINITGNIYAPTAAVTFQGNPTLNLGGNNCGEIVAASITWAGNATFDDSGCKAAGVPVPQTQVVQLVQ
jgi:Flp pilus assembly protein TadG